LLPEIPSDLEDIVLRCLSKAPEQRFQTAAEIDAALEAFEERERALGRGELYTRRLLAQWLAAPGQQPTAFAGAPQAAKPVTGPMARAPVASQGIPMFDTRPSVGQPAAFAGQPMPADPQPNPPKPAGGKGKGLLIMLIVLVLAGAGLIYVKLRGVPDLSALFKKGEPAATQAQVGLPANLPQNAASTATPPPERPPTGTQPSVIEPSIPSASGSAAAKAPGTPPAASTVSSMPGAAAVKAPPIPPAGANAGKTMISGSSGKKAATGGGAPAGTVTKPVVVALAAVPARTPDRTAAQAEPVDTRPAGGFLIFVDADQSSERLPLALAQSRVAEIVREAGHQVVSAGAVSTNVRAALDRNDLAEVRRNGVGHVIMGTASGSLTPQTAYGSTYYVAQVSVSFELVRMSDGRVAANGSSNAKSKGSANAQAALSEALMTATSDATRELMRNFK
jgi:hypothetical protein